MSNSTDRYAGFPTLVYVPADGRPIVYLSRRIVPQPATITSQCNAAVQQSDLDRLDLIAVRTLRQAELFWRLADANAAMNPFDLTWPAGRELRVPVPQV